eukprot:6332946-Amphidinium_carterae.1
MGFRDVALFTACNDGCIQSQFRIAISESAFDLCCTCLGHHEASAEKPNDQLSSSDKVQDPQSNYISHNMKQSKGSAQALD